MNNLGKAMGQNEPEVLLGVRLPGDSTVVDEEVSDEDIDSMLMSHGFEYIDASRPLPPKNVRDEEDDGELLSRFLPVHVSERGQVFPTSQGSSTL